MIQQVALAATSGKPPWVLDFARSGLAERVAAGQGVRRREIPRGYVSKWKLTKLWLDTNLPRAKFVKTGFVGFLSILKSISSLKKAQPFLIYDLS